MVRVLITGASGFIGSHVTRLALEAGAEVGILALPGDRLERLEGMTHRLVILRGEMGTPDAYGASLERFMPQTCLHLAWCTEPGKYLRSKDNVTLLVGSLTLFDRLAQAQCEHVLMVGTCAEYHTDVGYLREESPVRPATIYAAAKHSLHIVGEQLASAAGIGLTWARLFYLYGDGEDPRRLVPSVIRSLRAGQEFHATGAEQVRDYLHVSDVAAALWHLAIGRHPGTYNVCSGTPITVKALLETAGEILGCQEKLRFGALPDRDWEPQFIVGDNRKLRGTGWAARMPLREGLQQTIDWWSCQVAR